MKTFEIWGPATGSSRVIIQRSKHGRIVIHATTDFGEAKCHFTDAQAHQIRNALDLILEEKP